MPSVAEIEAIETTLKASLGRSKELDQNVASASQRVLLQSIKFTPADKPHSLQLSSLKSKYILLKTNKGEHPQKPLQAGFGRSEHDKAAEMSVPGPSGDAGMGDSLPSPRVVIYPPERIRLEWRQMHKIGGGLVNLGNTCFMNSILQCLTYTAPLVNYCFSDEHPNTCQQQSFCLMCELRRHIKLALHNCGTAFKPNSILQKLKFIAKHFKYGKQEDAHEFLRYLVDGLQRACLNGYAKLDKFSKETTVINQIFGGFLRSQVQCMKCSARSNTYDPFMDLSLDIKGVYTLEDALAKYIKTETLDSDNAYKCEKCQQKVPAQKRFSIHKAPNVLTVQLNRFDYNRMAGKINRHIQFPEKLNIRPYMSQKQGEPVYYHLYGVLIHQGNHCSMGHYYCYVKAPSNVWYVMNDSMVHTVSSNRVFQAEAYLLFYTKAVGNHHQIPSKGSFSGPNANGIVTPKFNGVINKQASIGTAVSAKANNDLGVPIPRQMSPIETPQTTFSGSSAVASLPPKHNKISFGIAPKPFQSAQKQNTAGGNSTSSPRIVMQIKNGKVTTIEKSPDGKSKVVKCSSSRQSTLVPYDDDSESGGEGTSRDMAKKSNNKGPRVALNFRDQEKEKHVHENVSNFAQGAFMSSGSSTLPKNASQKDKIENTVEGPHIVGSLTAVKHRGTDGTVPHLDLMLNRDSSGLKKMAIDTQSTTKINATSTSWFVQAKDSVPSPSLGSCSSNNSNHSVNSTTEWTVEPEGKTKSSLEKKQSPSLCWKVTTSPVKERKGFLLRSESLEDKQKPVKKVKRSSSVEPLSLWNKPVLSNSEEHHSLDGFQTTAARRTGDLFGAKMDDSASVGCNSVQALSSSDNVNGIVRLAFAACASHSKDGDETLEQNGHHSGEEMKPLLQQDDCFSSQKAHKKHKKKKRKRDKDGEKIKVKYSQLQESVISEDAEPRRKHKKKKHKRDRDCFDSDYKEKRHRDLDESDSDHKRKRYSSYCDLDGEGQSARKRRRSESSDSEYTWEERTKETLLNKKSETAVPVQGWDDYVQDNLGKGTKQDKNNCLESRLLWDGSKKSHVLEDLQRRPSVMSWDGEKSKAGTEAEEEERRRNRKSWFERYEEDIDRGKVKKVKKKAHEIPWAFNPFQKHQNIKNQERDKWRDNYDSHHKPQNSGCSPSLGRSYSDQTSYRHFSGSQYHHDHYNRSNSTNSHHVSFHRSQSHQSYQKRH